MHNVLLKLNFSAVRLASGQQYKLLPFSLTERYYTLLFSWSWRPNVVVSFGLSFLFDSFLCSSCARNATYIHTCAVILPDRRFGFRVVRPLPRRHISSTSYHGAGNGHIRVSCFRFFFFFFESYERNCMHAPEGIPDTLSATSRL